MPMPSILSILAQSRGISIEQLIRDTLDTEETVEKASRALGISHNVIPNWVKKNGYGLERRCKTVLVKLR